MFCQTQFEYIFLIYLTLVLVLGSKRILLNLLKHYNMGRWPEKIPPKPTKFQIIYKDGI